MAVRPALIAALALAVLLLHMAAIDWLAARWPPPAFRKLARPMYTRQITQHAPSGQKIARNTPFPHGQSSRRAITSIAKSSLAKKPEPYAKKPPKKAVPGASPDAAAKKPSADAAAHEPAAPEPTSPEEAARAAALADQPSTSAETPPTPAAPSAEAPAAPDADDPLPGWPNDTRLNYALSGYYNGELHGSAQVLWQHEGNDYETVIEIDLGLLLNLKLKSQGRITTQGLSPRAYEELQRTRRRGVRLEGDVVVLNDGKRVNRPPGVQDTASQFVELAHRFATGQVPLAAGQTITLALARPGAVDSWTYDVVGKVLLATPTLGAVEAWHLKPRPLVRPGGNISAEIWFAPSLQYLPVKIKVSMNESTWVDLVVMRIDQR